MSNGWDKMDNPNPGVRLGIFYTGPSYAPGIHPTADCTSIASGL